MRILISTLLFLCAAVTAAAQTYVIDTVAGSTVIPTGPATGWSLGNPQMSRPIRRATFMSLVKTSTRSGS